MNICVYTNVIVNIYNKLAKLSTTGFYLTKLDEIGYQVCFSSWRDVYETIQNPEFLNPAIGGIWENVRFVRSNGRKTTFE